MSIEKPKTNESSQEQGTMQKIRNLMDEFALTRKTIPVLAIIGILGSMEAQADSDVDSEPDLQSKFERLTETHEAGPDIKLAIQDFEKSATPSVLDAGDELLYSASLVGSYDSADTEVLYTGTAGEIPHLGQNITVDAGSVSGVFEDIENKDVRFWSGLKMRVSIAVESDTITPYGEPFETDGTGFTAEEAILSALEDNRTTWRDTESEETRRLREEVQNESVDTLDQIYIKTNSLHTTVISEYRVVSIEPVEDDEFIKYKATLSIQPGVIQEASE